MSSEDYGIIPIENSPEMLTKMADSIGADTSKFTLSTIYSFDEEILATIPQPIKAIILLFPFGKENSPIRTRHSGEKVPEGDLPYYTKQKVQNLCGTIALIHAILNNLDIIPLKADSILDKFYKHTKSLTPDERGLELTKEKELFAIHNAISNASNGAQEGEKALTHYSCFIEHAGHIWELDGRLSNMVDHGVSSNFATQVFQIIQTEFIDKLEGMEKFMLDVVALSKI
ncbi:Clan CA, family C12, ubiquitin hydrolase-like cysteine peptidase [Trichomonas vaginalis G3]|uniref:Ubiquitin carboxyl-terminal hydrolase n=1 Tax=Trichomonas vaginalis (strain ATCC PRA-98 / G3) TaxID=412133 RepID=A2G055_TRIV3|nr:thiol-dependent ubiquitin-specific protease protein [Trichomonas vaginalis G3]EAX89457.1 Clan CA, family C12, ubiquitin hydrolase-like cysteine peptidase [Trichomonas vaginalis G3]KAI5485304.1 thiol-dependent ubiquitin-specific protease protein [Trichomonas vaginalis G3]|eukprot:XP_001302387.1 Clan CA, family C12, ubiquitin hydrolase-like cysteine peptidase [Trichomonas vaginalis G3]